MTIPLEFYEGVTLEAGAVHVSKTEWVDANHYNYRVVRCPPKMTYSGEFTQVFDGGFDYITSKLSVASDAAPGVYFVVVEWGWSDQPITFGDALYILRLRFEVRVKA